MKNLLMAYEECLRATDGIRFKRLPAMAAAPVASVLLPPSPSFYAPIRSLTLPPRVEGVTPFDLFDWIQRTQITGRQES